jgi:DNA-binding NarL/FixJ family response regulator
MKPRVLLLEDDYLQRQAARQVLERALDVEVLTQTTESEFRRDFETIAADPPRAAVLDLMVRWANPARDMPPAPDDVRGNPQKAGLRCSQRLREDPRTSGVKIILYSVLPKEEIGADELSGDEICLVKEPDWQNLVEALRRSLD